MYFLLAEVKSQKYELDLYVLLTFWRQNYFFLILAHSVYKMWIKQEPKR